LTGEAYDHLMALVVFGVIFTAAVFIVPSLSYVNLLYLHQQQLQNVALSAMKTILFDAGYPSNWGSMHGTNMFNETDVQRFGLAEFGDPSLYVLDSNKVQRLANNPMGNISYSKVKELLGLSGYDFSIILRPLFIVDRSVTIQKSSDQATATITWKVNVSRSDGQPVPKAIVFPTVICAIDSNTGFETRTETDRAETNMLGRSQGTIVVYATDNGKIKDVIVIFRVTVADRATIVVSSQDTEDPGDIAKINVVGDTIVLTLPPDAPGSSDARWITNIQLYNYETSISLLNGSGTGTQYKLNYGPNLIVWAMAFAGLDSTEPGVLIITFRTETLGPGGRTLAILIGPWALWNQGGIMKFNPLPVGSGASASIERDVIIAGMAYVAELRLWKA